MSVGERVPEVGEVLDRKRAGLVMTSPAPGAGDMQVAGVEPPSSGVEEPLDIGVEPSEGDLETRRPKLSPVNNLSL